MTGVLLYSVEQIRRIEDEHARAHPEISLMQRAGESVARLAEEMLDGSGGRILVLAGPGNNGGDAWVAARALQKSWHRVTVVSATSEKSLANEAQIAREEFSFCGGRLCADWPRDEDYDLVIDGLLGIGVTRAVTGAMAALIARANSSGLRVLAIDVPSGLCAKTGNGLGETMRAERTLSFIGAKPGLYGADGRDHSGSVRIDALGVEAALLASPNTLLAPENLRNLVPTRRQNSHKGMFGSVGIIGGAPGMTGAAVLAARAALHLGAGKVFIAPLAEEALALDPVHPEIMVRKARDLLARESLNALVLGPGMGVGDSAKNLVSAALKLPLPLVIDADALNLIAAGRALQNQLARREAPSLLTPHPGEAARLLQSETRDVQSDRIRAACTLARRFKAHVVLKGSGSVVALTDGSWHLNSTGNPGMASGGMGDALAGMLGALLVQDLDPADALKLATCLHGAAADRCIERGIGPLGLTATDVLIEARALLNAW